MAMARWPTFTWSESPHTMGRRLSAGTSTCRTARSESGSVPTMVAGTLVPSENVTNSWVVSATTWLLVTMWPCKSITKPEPSPISW